MNLLVFNLLLCTDCTLLVQKSKRLQSRFGLNVVYCAERFNCSVNDLIYDRLPIIINFYVRIPSTKLYSVFWLAGGSLL